MFSPPPVNNQFQSTLEEKKPKWDLHINTFKVTGFNRFKESLPNPAVDLLLAEV